jgi:hypothetical protein
VSTKAGADAILKQVEARVDVVGSSAWIQPVRVLKPIAGHGGELRWNLSTLQAAE